MLEANAIPDDTEASVQEIPEGPRVVQTPLRSQQEKRSIEERLGLYHTLPKRRERIGFYKGRPISSKVDSFRLKKPL
ncbi:Hypothetical predicted protein [Podarcis lilfordi]|nr:Hypothetical predicted protein [Podarcis lilfordi]